MTLDQVFWLLGRATGMASYVALCISVLSGLAMRTAVLEFLAKGKALRALHDFTTWLWLPLGAIHVVTLVLDKTAHLTALDVVLPFGVSYSPLAIGLGTISLDLFALVVVTSWLKQRMNQRLWRWIHRLSYLGFASLVLHAVRAGTDFDAPAVSAISWSLAAAVAILAFARILWGRLPE